MLKFGELASFAICPMNSATYAKRSELISPKKKKATVSKLSLLFCAIYFLVFSYESKILRVKSEYILQVI